MLRQHRLDGPGGLRLVALEAADAALELALGEDGGLAAARG